MKMVFCVLVVAYSHKQYTRVIGPNLYMRSNLISSYHSAGWISYRSAKSSFMLAEVISVSQLGTPMSDHDYRCRSPDSDDSDEPEFDSSLLRSQLSAMIPSSSASDYRSVSTRSLSTTPAACTPPHTTRDDYVTTRPTTNWRKSDRHVQVRVLHHTLQLVHASAPMHVIETDRDLLA